MQSQRIISHPCWYTCLWTSCPFPIHVVWLSCLGYTCLWLCSCGEMHHSWCMQPVLGEMRGVPGHRSSHCPVRGDTSLVVCAGGQEAEGYPLPSSLITHILHAVSIRFAAMQCCLGSVRSCKNAKNLKKKPKPTTQTNKKKAPLV